MEKKNYLHATQEAGKAFYLRQLPGPISMLNLLKFRDTADYSEHPELAPSSTLSGKEAYQLYMDHTLPFLKNAGSKLIFYGKGGPFLIGPEHEGWDAVLIVRHKSTAKFLEFATNQAYLEGAGHRTAALADSRLLPMEEVES